MADRPVERPPAPPVEGRPNPARPGSSGEAQRFRRRLRWGAVLLVLAWTVLAALITGMASGYWGTLGLPADAEHEDQPRGLIVIGAATLLAAVATTVTYRRVSGPVGDLLLAADQVTTGAYGTVDVDVRGPRELRLLTATFNEMAARLAADEEHRRRFLADITHELRNPLAVLQSEIEAQLDGVHPRDDHHLLSLLDETRRLGHLVDDLHTLALAETGRLALQQEVVALGGLVDEVVGRHEAHARQRAVALRASVAPGLPKAWADPARIRQVLDNLLANAIRHTPAGGEVVIEVSAGDGPAPGPPAAVRFRVTDAGPGFRDDQLGQVFERFKRAGDSSGSGLGLSIARDLVRAHGGTIEAGNDPTTGGASVSFTLPT
ncbi:HAMP domain-containing histidine kinase [Iamia sp. SCSIO 61187]|uniref:sensor histidine kinase n=1 Tax=Iamia sp. SCSIO 61187 TaxID=2722752 RepID=UPI001C630E4D|nr:HAMP domain-containing sensor histidine kinase [Iamia sp. SCSIO 61187]QYG92492.1 HAMP domain-containing histidine kinase [Iamia sp. SCSIO 61187]